MAPIEISFYTSEIRTPPYTGQNDRSHWCPLLMYREMLCHTIVAITLIAVARSRGLLP